jgi:hypothetical protein
MVVVTLVSLAVVGIAGNFLGANDLFTSPKYQTEALASLGVILGSLVVFGALGRPWRWWSRTSYW